MILVLRCVATVGSALVMGGAFIVTLVVYTAVCVLVFSGSAAVRWPAGMATAQWAHRRGLDRLKALLDGTWPFSTLRRTP